MSAPDYTDIDWSAARAQERSGVAETVLIKEQLYETSGKNADDKVIFRPYWVAADLLDQRRQQVTSGDGASFRDVEKNIDALRGHQWFLDESLGTQVPFALTRAGFRAKRGVRTTFIDIQSVG